MLAELSNFGANLSVKLASAGSSTTLFDIGPFIIPVADFYGSIERAPPPKPTRARASARAGAAPRGSPALMSGLVRFRPLRFTWGALCATSEPRSSAVRTLVAHMSTVYRPKEQRAAQDQLDRGAPLRSLARADPSFLAPSECLRFDRARDVKGARERERERAHALADRKTAAHFNLESDKRAAGIITISFTRSSLAKCLQRAPEFTAAREPSKVNKKPSECLFLQCRLSAFIYLRCPKLHPGEIVNCSHKLAG